jgi:hypothetical protein
MSFYIVFFGVRVIFLYICSKVGGILRLMIAGLDVIFLSLSLLVVMLCVIIIIIIIIIK